MANKPQANHGDIAEYRHQGKAIWSNGTRLSEHEHVEAHINLVKQTTNPETGQTSYDKGAYRHSVTITIPRDMAVEKTKLDMQLRDKLKAAWESGDPIDDKLMQELGPEAAIQRTIDARETVRERRIQAGESTADLDAVTDEKIKTACYLQRGAVAESQRGEPLPVQYPEDYVDRMFDASMLEKHETPAPSPQNTTQATQSESPATETSAASVQPAPPPPCPPLGQMAAMSKPTTGPSNSTAAQTANSKESSPSVTSAAQESFDQSSTKPQPSSPQIDGTRQPSTVQQQGVSPKEAGSAPATTPAPPPPCPPLGQMAAMSKPVTASSTVANTNAPTGMTGPDFSKQAFEKLRTGLNEAAKFNVSDAQVENAIDNSINPQGASVEPAKMGSRTMSKGYLGEDARERTVQALGEISLNDKLGFNKTNQGGIDGPTIALDENQEMVLCLDDNKNYAREGKVYSVSALQENLTQNLESLKQDWNEIVADPNSLPIQKAIAGTALALAEAGRTQLRVSNFGGNSTGTTLPDARFINSKEIDWKNVNNEVNGDSRNSTAAQIANSKESSPLVTSTDRESFSQPATKPQPSSPQVDGTRQPSTVQQQGVSPNKAGSAPATTPAPPPPCPPLGQMAAMSKPVVASPTSTNTSAGTVANSAGTGRLK